MSTRRLALTTLVMALIAWALTVLVPGLPGLREAFATPQRVADRSGPDVLVSSWVGGLAWLVWAWGLLGLVLTAATALPGVLGGAARVAQRVLLPAAARRGAAVAIGLGMGIGLGAPLASAAPPPAPGTTTAVPDWPVADDPPPVPDWPAQDQHVVVRGDCLWDIAAGRLTTDAGHPPTDAEIARAVPAWWRANSGVIGDDPDLLLPGQVLRPPGAA